MPDVFTVFLNNDDDDVPSDYNRVITPPPPPLLPSHDEKQPGTKTFIPII